MNFKNSYIKDRRIIVLVIVFLALAMLDVHYGLHFGIEFIGGTQIPVTLELYEYADEFALMNGESRASSAPRSVLIFERDAVTFACADASSDFSVELLGSDFSPVEAETRFSSADEYVP